MGDGAAVVRVVALARRQLGLVSTAQCCAIGIDKRWIQRRVEKGVWQRVLRGVFKSGPGPVTREELELAVLLAGGERIALSHHTAARHWGLDVPRERRVQVITPEDRRLVLPGVQIWRSRTLKKSDVAEQGPFRLTSMARTVLDLASVLDDKWLRACVDSALRQRRHHLGWLWALVHRHGQGSRGASRLLRRLVEYEDGAELPDSALESFAMELGLMTGRKPQLHRIVEGRSVDFVFPEVLLCVELDSWRHHGSRDAFLRDRARDRALSAAGWQVLRYTWREIEANPRRYVDELACVYAQREIVARALAARLITL